MSKRAPWAPTRRRRVDLEPYEREQVRAAIRSRRETHGTLDARSVRTLQQHHGISRATVYRIGAEEDPE